MTNTRIRWNDSELHTVADHVVEQGVTHDDPMLYQAVRKAQKHLPSSRRRTIYPSTIPAPLKVALRKVGKPGKRVSGKKVLTDDRDLLRQALEQQGQLLKLLAKRI